MSTRYRSTRVPLSANRLVYTARPLLRLEAFVICACVKFEEVCGVSTWDAEGYHTLSTAVAIIKIKMVVARPQWRPRSDKIGKFQARKKCFAERKVWFKLKLAWLGSIHNDPITS